MAINGQQLSTDVENPFRTSLQSLHRLEQVQAKCPKDEKSPLKTKKQREAIKAKQQR
jgi:hypothetical protein